MECIVNSMSIKKCERKRKFNEVILNGTVQSEITSPKKKLKISN
jgi:hypothetical protein